MSFYVSEKAMAELAELQRMLLSSVGRHLVTAEEAKKQYWERVRSIISQSYQHTDDSVRPIPIQCAGCGRVSVTQSNVKTYHCVCSPHRERWVSQSRWLDMPLGTNAVEHLLTSSDNPVSFTE